MVITWRREAGGGRGYKSVVAGRAPHQLKDERVEERRGVLPSSSKAHSILPASINMLSQVCRVHVSCCPIPPRRPAC